MLQEKSNPTDYLWYAENMLEFNDPGMSVEEKTVLYVAALRSIRSMRIFVELGYDPIAVQNCANLGLDFETLEPVNGALQQPDDSDIT